MCRLLASNQNRFTLCDVDGTREAVEDVETLRAVWHQFNVEELALPDYRKMIADEKLALEFIHEKDPSR